MMHAKKTVRSLLPLLHVPSAGALPPPPLRIVLYTLLNPGDNTEAHLFAPVLVRTRTKGPAGPFHTDFHSQGKHQH